MGAFLFRRIVSSAFVVLGVSVLAFSISHLTGDPAALMLPPEASPEDLDAFRHAMGYDRPVHIQYLDFLSRAVRGDLGNSLWQHRPALELVAERIPASAELALTSLTVSVLVAFPMGILAAINRGSVFDRLLTVGAVLGFSMPVFWLGLILMDLFSVRLGLLPTSGRDGIVHLILPSMTLGVYFAAVNARLVRSSMVEVLGEAYITTARGKGLSERTVLLAHALKNASIPVVTQLGLQVGSLMGGAILTETVFAWPGLGRLIVQSVTRRDFPLLQAGVLVTSLIFVTVNFLLDVLYGFLDPRIKYD